MVESINSWSARAKCRNSPDDSVFFPKDTHGVAKGRRFCTDCPVKELCKAYALVHSLPGIWGGTSELERSKISPLVRDLLRQVYQQAGLIESPYIPVGDYQLEIGDLEVLQLELSDPIEDAVAG